MRTTAAHAASAFVSERRTIFTARPRVPDIAAIARDVKPGLKIDFEVSGVESAVAMDTGCLGAKREHGA
jgi:hypothetical protein